MLVYILKKQQFFPEKQQIYLENYNTWYNKMIHVNKIKGFLLIYSLKNQSINLMKTTYIIYNDWNYKSEIPRYRIFCTFQSFYLNSQ